jgi:hypothetical protein
MGRPRAGEPLGLSHSPGGPVARSLGAGRLAVAARPSGSHHGGVACRVVLLCCLFAQSDEALRPCAPPPQAASCPQPWLAGGTGPDGRSLHTRSDCRSGTRRGASEPVQADYLAHAMANHRKRGELPVVGVVASLDPPAQEASPGRRGNRRLHGRHVGELVPSVGQLRELLTECGLEVEWIRPRCPPRPSNTCSGRARRPSPGSYAPTLVVVASRVPEVTSAEPRLWGRPTRPGRPQLQAPRQGSSATTAPWVSRDAIDVMFATAKHRARRIPFRHRRQRGTSAPADRLGPGGLQACRVRTDRAWPADRGTTRLDRCGPCDRAGRAARSGPNW